MRLFLFPIFFLATIGADAKADLPYSTQISINSFNYTTNFAVNSVITAAGTFSNAASKNGLVASIGSEKPGVTTISIQDYSSTFENSEADATLSYQWEVKGNSPFDTAPVLVHLTSLGFIAVSNEMVPFPGYNLYAKQNTAGVSATFSSSTPSGYTSTVVGVTTGRLNWGVPKVQSINSYDHLKSSANGSFSASFSIWVLPNKINSITLQATTILETNADYIGLGYEYASARAYIDPTITIDPAYSASYTLEQSAVPVVPSVAVPELNSATLFMGGLAVVSYLGRRRPLKQTVRSSRAT